MVLATGDLGNINVLEVVGKAIVERFETVDFTFNSVELGESLAEIQRFGFPFLNIGLKIFHLLADGFASGLEFFESIRAEELD